MLHNLHRAYLKRIAQRNCISLEETLYFKVVSYLKYMTKAPITEIT